MEQRKRKILYIGNKLSSKGSNLTGVEVLGGLLEKEGYNVVSVSSVSNKILRLLDMLRSVIVYSKKTDFILIDTYSTTNFWYAYFCGQLAYILKIPFYCILRGGDLPVRLKRSPKSCKSLFSKAKNIIALSGYLLKEFQQKGFTNLIYIPNSINIKDYTFQERKSLQPKLLWVRSFSEIYNPLLAVQILEQLQKKYSDAELCMVGPEKDGSLAVCKAYAEKQQLNVKFTGRLSKPEWTKLSCSYDFFINTTNFDNTPISVIEAMALGIPVISTNVGGLPFLIQDKEEGLLIPPNNKEFFVDAIEFLMINPDKAMGMSVEARKRIEKFDWGNVKEKWNEVLQ